MPSRQLFLIMHSTKITIRQYDDRIVFSPVPNCIKEALTIWEKDLNGMRPLEMFAVADTDDGEVCVTYPGFAGRIAEAAFKHGVQFDIVDKRKACIQAGFPAPKLDAMYGFRFSQEALITEALKKDCSGLIGAPTRYGKCLGIDTKLLTADYDIVKVQDVKVGDTIMGPDGTARTVAALGRGREQSYRIVPNKGEPFTCNESHILPLKVTGGAKMGGWKKGDIVFVTVKEYLGKSKTFKHITKLWYAALDFQEAQLPVDPWVVGVWIGDGRFDGGSRLTKPDTAVQTGLIAWAEANGYTWEYADDNGKARQALKINTADKTAKGRYCSAFRQIADMCCVDGEKRIPKQYLTAARRQRLELLAGLIDTDGSVNNGMGYEITTKYDGLSEDIIRLCRGLGFRVTRTRKVSTIKSLDFSGEYWRMQISGPLPDIPCRSRKRIDSVNGRVDPTLTGFAVEDIGEQDYYGISVDGPDKMFLLWDHLVTHNTTLMVNTLRAYPSLPAVVVAPGVDLVDQLYDDLRGARGIKGREIKKITGTTSKVPSTDGITVCTIDCLEHVDESLPRLLLVDEPHALVTDHRLGLLNKFTKARRLGFGATLKGRFDNRDALITGAFGPVLANRTYQEAVTEGAVCQLNVIFLKIELTPQYFFSRNKAYDSALFLSATMAKTVADICRNVIPKDLQTLIFIANKAQAELYLDAMGDEAELAMAMLFKNKKEREALVAKVKENDIKRCLCTNIFVQGVTFSDLAVLVNCNAGAKYTNTIQKPGRLAEIRPGKKCGVVIDFMFVPPEDYDKKDVKSDTWLMPSKDSAARKKVYKDMGYGIYEVDSVEEMKEVFDSMI